MAQSTDTEPTPPAGTHPCPLCDRTWLSALAASECCDPAWGSD